MEDEITVKTKEEGDDQGQDSRDDDLKEQDDSGEKSRRIFVIPPKSSNFSPTVVFQYTKATDVPPRENVEHAIQLPKDEILKYYCKWERNSIKGPFKDAGLVRTRSKKFWDVYWGGQIKTSKWSDLKGVLKPWKKINHFPGTWALGRKDNLGMNIRNLQRKYGNAFKFIPETFVWPRDEESFKRWLAVVKSRGDRNLKFFIKKPVASSRGRGIRVHPIREASRILHKMRKKYEKKKRQYLLQRYIHRPLLINRLKFDIRLYVLVTCFNPLVVFMFNEGLVRFCTEPFTMNESSSAGHLTNYSVQKHTNVFQENQCANEDDTGHKWSYTALLRRIGKDFGEDKVHQVRRNIERLVAKTLISVEETVNSTTSRLRSVVNTSLGANCFEVFGFDVMLDQDLIPSLIEVNTSPSLTANSPLDKRVKGMLISDTLHLVGVQRRGSSSTSSRETIKTTNRLVSGVPSSSNARTRQKMLSIKERRSIPISKWPPLDVETVKQFEEQYRRRGHYKCVFPSPENLDLYNYIVIKRQLNVAMRRWMEMKRVRQQHRHH